MLGQDQLDVARQLRQMQNLGAGAGGSYMRPPLTLKVIDEKLEQIDIKMTSLQTERSTLNELRKLLIEFPTLAKLVELGQKLGML